MLELLKGEYDYKTLRRFCTELPNNVLSLMCLDNCEIGPGQGWVCTLEKGHKGPHMACNADEHYLHRW